MKALIIGYGSIGRRHCRLLLEKPEMEVALLRRPGGAGFESPPNCRVFHDLDSALEAKPDFAVVANPTSLHVRTALELVKAEIPFLLEKPVSHDAGGLNDLLVEAERKRIPAMTAFQMRFDPLYQKLKRFIDDGVIGRPLHLSARVGQYLPDWRPGTDYRECYSARKELGGGVLLDLCHQFDIATSLMGEATGTFCRATHLSRLEMDVEDVADVVIRHVDGRQSQLHFNCLEQNYTWWNRVIGEKGDALWDYGAGSLTITRPGKSPESWSLPAGFQRDDLFRLQLDAWLQALNGLVSPPVDLREGAGTTMLVVAAKQSSETGQFINL